MDPWWLRGGLLVSAGGVGSYAVAALQVPPGADLPRHVGWFLFAFVFYLMAVALVLAAERRGGGAERPWIDLGIILGIALVLRVALLAATPSLSDDLFRYVWDGRLQNAGVSPYLYPPSAPELAALRDPLWEGINHKSMLSPYPPLAEALFFLTYRLAPDSLQGMQMMAVLFDLGIMALLIPMLSLWGIDRRRVLLWAWNPLVLLQFAHSAHYDSAMILPLLAAIYLLGLGRRFASGGALGLSVLVKLVPAVAAPPFLPAMGIPGMAAMAGVIAVGLVPWLGAGASIGGLLSEAGDARFNDSLSYVFGKILGLMTENSELISRSLSSGLVLASSLLLGAYLWRHGANWRDVLRATYWLLGLFLLLNAVVEPWYLTWMIPFLCFLLPSSRSGLPCLDPALGWLLLSGTVVLTDLTYQPQFAASSWIWIRTVEYLPLYGLLAHRVWGIVIAPMFRPASAWQ